ncbi:MAG: 1-deoxy-D-xylulose-5-phosphate synthase [Dehalococcoidia bacterium]|jgi:1-deoxy-D-xylulose-5-phosphate synthase|nr:1-deoxy-D-xylulose-5-phosphate synthase [Dehalococcoidia bacterium]
MTDLLTALDQGRDLKSLSSDEMTALAAEVRELLVNIVHENGDAGHLASNLGAVEVTLALHRVFDTPYDKIIWDVGHQAYVHKILTGRRGQMGTLRRQGGIAGFPDRRESEHDSFGVGHAGTALSAAAGYAIARDLRHEEHEIVAVVGDGALTAGMSFEALNHLGHMASDVIVVLNDNEMSISPNVGAINRSINRLRVGTAYRDFKVELKNFVTHLPAGDRLWDEWRRLKRVPRDFIVQSGFWDQLGFDYYGPIDGHDIDVMESTLKSVRHFTGKPALVHVLTQKGHGVPEAEADPVRSHSGTFWMKEPSNGSGGGRTYSQVFGDTARELCLADERVVVITPAMLEGSGLTALQEEFPDRVLDVGIAEQHAVTAAAGVAAAGMRPIVAIYSTFLQRGFDSVVHDVVVQGLPVVFAIDRAGVVGEDGRTHQGFADISFLRCLPGMVIAAPVDDAELEALLKTAMAHDGPFAIRYPRGRAPSEIAVGLGDGIRIGSGTTLREGSDVALVGLGAVLPDCLEAAELLQGEGTSAAVINARFAKPLDEELILGAAQRTGGVVTVEDNVRAGGFGEAVLSLLAEHGMADRFLGAIALPDEIVEHATQAQQRAACGIDVDGIARSVRALLPSKPAAPPVEARS